MKTLFILLVISLTFITSALTQTLSDSLVAYFPFNGNANDVSGFGNNGIVYSATLTEDRFGNANSAYQFDGFSFIEVVNSPSLDITGSMTISVWAKGKAASTNISNLTLAGIVAKTHSVPYGLCVDDGDRALFQIFKDSVYYQALIKEIQIDSTQWYHYVGVYESSTSLKLYINGQNVLTLSDSIPESINSSTANLWIGTRSESTNPAYPRYFFDGSIDDIRIYTRALNLEDIDSLYNEVPSPVMEQTQPVAYYPFNGNADDESGFGNNGIVYGATLTEDRFGTQNSAFQFDGLDDYIVIPHSQSLNLNSYYNSYSLSLWVKSNDPQSGARILSKWNENIHTPYPFSIQASSEKCNAGLFDTQDATSIKYGIIWDNEWHHIVMVVDAESNEMYGYLNNTLIDSNDISNLLSTANTSDIYIGLRPIHFDHFKGEIDDISIYNRALSPSEIDSLYNYQPSLFADFSADTTSGIDSLLVSFTDLSISTDSLDSIKTWQWDFENDGIIDSYEQNPGHMYAQSGVYSVKLIVSNSSESAQRIKTDYIKVRSIHPQITSILDIPNDQGGWVKVNFEGSAYDTDSLIFPKVASAELYTVEIDDGSGWTAAASTAAYGKDIYSVLVPTTKDSTIYSSGLISFRIIATMDEGNFVSEVATGYSLDNLRPSVPEGIIANFGNSGIELKWSANTENDFKFYSIYRSTEGNLAEKLADTVAPLFTDSDILPGKNYAYAVSATDHSGNESDLSEFVNFTITNLNELSSIPTKYYLAQNFPNPFNPETTIRFGLPKAGQVKIIIFDILGRTVQELLNANLPAGHHQIVWNGTNQFNTNVSSSVYFYMIITKEFTQTRKMLIGK